MKLIDNKTKGYYKASSNIGQVKIVIQYGIMKVYNTEKAWLFNINKSAFDELDDYIIFVAGKFSDIQIYKPLEEVKHSSNDIQDLSWVKKRRKFEVD